MHSQTNTINEYEAQININNRRLREYEQQISMLKERIDQLEEESSKARAEASRLNMNLLMNSQAELQKSMARERIMDKEMWN